MKISDRFAKKKPILSFEIYPPKYDTTLTNIDETLRELAILSPDFISVTFGAGGSTNNNKTIALAKKIKKEYGIEPLVHLTCLSYERSEIDTFLTELANAGIENILALRGDHRPEAPAKNDFTYASDLISYIKAHDEEKRFCVAAACYPECHPKSTGRDADIAATVKKTDDGASFLVSQLFFENEVFTSFITTLKESGCNVPVNAGVMPVINKKQIERMISLCGASLPERFKKILDRYGENQAALFDAGLAHATSQITDLIASGADGIHLYTMNNPAVAKRIASNVKNIL